MESVAAVLPITAIVLLLTVAAVPLEVGTVLLFLTGAVLLIVGMGFFQLGAEMSMTPLGEGIGTQLFKTRSLPLTVGLAVLGRPALRLLAAHGRLTEENIAVEYGFLLASGACMVFLGIKEIADRALFALHTTKVSALVNGLILLLNVPLAWLLRRVPALGAYAIPLSWSAAVAAGAVVLLLCLRRRLGGFAGLLSAAGKTLIASTVMGGTVWGCRRLLAGRLGSLMALGLPVLLGVLVFFLMAALLRIPVLPRLRRTEK